MLLYAAFRYAFAMRAAIVYAIRRHAAGCRRYQRAIISRYDDLRCRHTMLPLPLSSEYAIPIVGHTALLTLPLPRALFTRRVPLLPAAMLMRYICDDGVVAAARQHSNGICAMITPFFTIILMASH